MPEFTAGFEEVEGAENVGLDEVVGSFNRAVHVRFGGKVEDVGDGVVADNAQDGGLVAQVHALEVILRADGGSGHVLQPPGVGEAVEVDDARDCRLRQHMVEHVGADEAAPAGDEEVHGVSMGRALRRNSTATLWR